MSPKRPFTILAILICVVVGVGQGQQQTYVLGPGDVVEVKVFGQPDLNATAQVDGEGNLSSLPFLDAISAKCRTEKQVQKDIAVAYSRLIKDPQVSVRVIDRKSRQPAQVSGAVRTPGKVPTERKLRLNELIAASGGITEKAAGTIQILHTESLLCPGPGEEVEALPVAGTAIPLQIVKLSDLQAGSVNPIIRSGDLVLVTEAVPVYITGSVVSPGSVMLTDQLTLSKALGMVGGTRKEAKLSEIKIYRQKGNAPQQVLKVDFEAVKKSQNPDIFLQPYDVIEVTDTGFLDGGNVLKVLAGIFLRSTPLPIPYD
ncbi:MAG TPA: polysaccharide biosynthesis/export family protein [Pyrinomonadaceae bacterium]|nr:polysaccharide biosynthesis/export family protein [Pyrinomonadaceae bacterium]